MTREEILIELEKVKDANARGGMRNTILMVLNTIFFMLSIVTKGNPYIMMGILVVFAAVIVNFIVMLHTGKKLNKLIATEPTP